MFRILIIAVLAAFLPSVASAQLINNGAQGALSRLGQGRRGLNVYNRPTVSPYLNLLRGNGNVNNSIGTTGGTYQRLVRPMLDQRAAGQQQQQQIRQIQNQLNRVQSDYRRPTSGQMSTGHPTRFMSYSHYYPGLGR